MQNTWEQLRLTKYFVENLQIKRPASRSIRKCRDNIKMDFIKGMCWHEKWIQLAQGKVWNQVVLNTDMQCRVS
jgi:hypothetical protein